MWNILNEQDEQDMIVTELVNCQRVVCMKYIYKPKTTRILFLFFRAKFLSTVIQLAMAGNSNEAQAM